MQKPGKTWGLLDKEKKVKYLNMRKGSQSLFIRLKNVQKVSENTQQKKTATYPMRNWDLCFCNIAHFQADTVEAEKMFTATGGVMVPTTLEMHTIMPKWITSMPILWAIGRGPVLKERQSRFLP